MASHTESNITITTIDKSQVSSAVSDDLNIVSVVNVPTGTYEEVQVNSVSEFIDEFLLSTEVSSTDDETIKNTCKLLQTTPVRCIRAANTKLRSGINNRGETIYTDKNFNPFEFSETFNLDTSNITAGNYGYLCFRNGGQDGSNISIYVDGVSYGDTKYTSGYNASSYGPIKVSPAAGETSLGIDVLIESAVDGENLNRLQNIVFDDSNASYHQIYTFDGVQLDYYPSFVDECNISNLSSSARLIEFANNQTVGTGDYINLNGYSFYLQKPNEVFNTVIPGTSVEVETSKIGTIYAKEFAVLVNDLLRRGSYNTPIYSEMRTSVTISGLSSLHISGSQDFIDAVVANGSSLEAYVTGEKVIKSGSRLIVSSAAIEEPEEEEEQITFGYTTSGTSSEPGSFIKNSTTGEYTGNLDFDSDLTIDLFRGATFEIITDTNVVYTESIGNDGTASILIDGESSAITLNINSQSIENFDSDYKYRIIFTRFAKSTSATTYVLYAGSEFKVLGPANSKITTISVSDDDVTPQLALVNFASTEKVELTYGTFKWVTLNSNIKTVLTNNENAIGITVGVDGLRRYTISKDDVNFENLKSSFAIKIDDNVFYCGTYNKSDNNEVLIPLDVNTLSFNEFILDFFQKLPSYYNCLGDNNSSFTLFNNTGTKYKVYWIANEEKSLVSGEQYNYSAELDSRFAVIANYTSKSAIFSVKLVEDGNWYKCTLSKKDESVDFEASFVKGTMNGYGVNIYFDAMNAKQTFCTFIELNDEADVQTIPTALSFGAEIQLPEPGLANYESALDNMLLENNIHYDFIFTGGYDQAQFIKYASDLVTNNELYCQVLANIPCTIVDKATAIEYRDATGVDNFQVFFTTPYYHDSTVGEFTCEISPSQAVLERFVANKGGQREFAPLFWKSNGRMNIATAMTSSSGLMVHYDTVEDRNALLSSQINCIKIDKSRGICYLNDQLTAQKDKSQLSDFNNVRMLNVLAHTCDSILDGYIAQFNDQSTRMNITSTLTNEIQSRMFTQQYKPNTVQVICDETNNTLAVRNRQELVVDVYIYFESIIKKVKVYQYVMPLQ